MPTLLSRCAGARKKTWDLRSTSSPLPVTVLGPVAADASWQTKAGEGFDKESFLLDWETQSVTCPAGKWIDIRRHHGPR